MWRAAPSSSSQRLNTSRSVQPSPPLTKLNRSLLPRSNEIHLPPTLSSCKKKPRTSSPSVSISPNNVVSSSSSNSQTRSSTFTRKEDIKAGKQREARAGAGGSTSSSELDAGRGKDFQAEFQGRMEGTIGTGLEGMRAAEEARNQAAVPKRGRDLDKKNPRGLDPEELAKIHALMNPPKKKKRSRGL